ncbi:hypothetical protein B0H17DRAFT_1199205 [Mycena rosella]|uniref:Uncharacterized protein n=1 Tax=Mycena rosella TaxID=1033263 RepID=A0AAD7DMN2_MYCRO|nr:hypothetical protein B0H17DRAFT_1199205 [Mycena rosella]
MREEVTAKAWGMYEETGLFLSLCRHGFMLMVCNMIRSGELSKYGYAVVHHLVEFLHEIAVGYDICCKVGKMMNARPVLGPLAHENHFKVFHEHGHCQLCQLSHLAMYVKGIGLDDLEYYEMFFSKSNVLAASTCCASNFHRKQAITTYLQHTDVYHTYQSLSLLIVNKYKRALELYSTMPPLAEAMVELGVTDKSTFVDWKRMQNVLAINIPPLPADPSATNYMEEAKATRQLKELETWMAIVIRWLPESEEWKAAVIMVGQCRYQHTLDELQGLIISRMFELTKMNMLETGYKLAVKTVLTNYNLATAHLRPPRAPMTWEQVVNYTFLDLLRDGREDIWEELWAKPAGQLAMDMYFKLERATEEIDRLNLEIPRFLTYMRDEEDFLCQEVVRIRDKDGNALAHQVERYHMWQSRFNDVHHERLWKLAWVSGLSTSMQTGTPVNKDHVRGQQGAQAAPAPLASATYTADDCDSDSEDGADVLTQEFVLLSVMEDIGGGMTSQSLQSAARRC